MNPEWKEIWQGSRFYLFWFISCAIGFVNLAVALNTVQVVAIVLGADQWTLPAIQRFALLGLIVLMVIFFFWSESRYRKASRQSGGALLRTFGLMTGGQILLLLVLYLVPLMLNLIGTVARDIGWL